MNMVDTVFTRPSGTNRQVDHFSLIVALNHFCRYRSACDFLQKVGTKLVTKHEYAVKSVIKPIYGSKIIKPQASDER